MKIQEYIEQVHQTAVEHGWHEEPHENEHWIMLIITEICEMIAADRKNRHANRQLFEHRLEVDPNDPDNRFKEWFKTYIKETFEDELADVCIRTFDFMGETGINAEQLAKIHTELHPDFDKQHLLKQSLDLIDVITGCETMPIVCSSIFAVTERLAELHHIDLDWHISQKMRYNRLRQWKHGGKAY